MKSATILGLVLIASVQTCSPACFSAVLTKTLSLSEAERFAISTAPELKQLQANTHSLEEQAIADGQQADPRLIANVVNVPTNSFSFTQDDMTMIQGGLQQAFAPGYSLAMKSKKTNALATAEQYKIHEKAAMMLRNLRETWLDLYYWKQAALIIQKNQSLYKELLKLTESEYSAGRRTESEVLQLRVDLTRLIDQNVQIDQHIEILRAQLGRWIGTNKANSTLSDSLPHWPNPPAHDILQSRLIQHPLLKVDAANINAAYDEVAFNKELYKPGWTLDVGYAVRQGRMSDGQPRYNMVSAQVTVDLPLFTGNRQDKRLCASAFQLESIQYDRDIHFKDLLKELSVQYATWQQLTKRQKLYRQHLRPEALQNSKATLLAYKNTTAEFSTLLRAYNNNLTISLEQIQIDVERAKARTALLYLECITK